MRGRIGLTNIDMMWSTGDFSVEFPGKAHQLPKNHYYAIASGLDYDPSTLHSMLRESFQAALVPGYFVCIDEIRIPATHYACPYKKYNNKKPDVWAIESKSLHDSSRYLFDFINPVQEKVPTPGESFFTMLQSLKQTKRNHHVTADSNFISALDIPKVTKLGFECTVSCKSDRPSILWKEGLGKGIPVSYSRVASSPAFTAVCTHNKGKVNLATTLYLVKDQKNLYKPENRRLILDKYDETKGYADQFGQLVKTYWPDGGFKKWHVALAGWVVLLRSYKRLDIVFHAF